LRNSSEKEKALSNERFFYWFIVVAMQGGDYIGITV
jgi:hypothetical protein